MVGMGKRREAAFAFGTRGDVLPVAVVVAALAYVYKEAECCAFGVIWNTF